MATTKNTGARIKLYSGNDKLFLKACELAEVNDPTRRQFVKWGQQRGLAHAKLAEAKAALTGIGPYAGR